MPSTEVSAKSRPLIGDFSGTPKGEPGFGAVLSCWHEGDLWVAMVRQRSSGAWLFPKGHPGQGDEPALDSALRELGEEIGIQSSGLVVHGLILPNLDDNSQAFSEAMPAGGPGSNEPKFHKREFMYFLVETGHVLPLRPDQDAHDMAEWIRLRDLVPATGVRLSGDKNAARELRFAYSHVQDVVKQVADSVLGAHERWSPLGREELLDRRKDEVAQIGEIRKTDLRIVQINTALIAASAGAAKYLGSGTPSSGSFDGLFLLAAFLSLATSFMLFRNLVEKKRRLGPLNDIDRLLDPLGLVYGHSVRATRDKSLWTFGKGLWRELISPVILLYFSGGLIVAYKVNDSWWIWYIALAIAVYLPQIHSIKRIIQSSDVSLYFSAHDKENM